MQKLYRAVSLDGVKAKNAGEYFGTLQESVTDMWREHLKTSKYSAHMALDEYYTEMPEKVDGFIEAYISVSGSKITDYKCNFQAKNLTPLEYLKLLKAFLEDGREEYCGGHSELESDLDDILGLIDSTIYKLRELREGIVMNLRDLVAEELGSEYVGEARSYKPSKFHFSSNWTVFGPNYVDGGPMNNVVTEFVVEDVKYLVVKGDGAMFFCDEDKLIELFGDDVDIKEVDSKGCVSLSGAFEYVLKIGK